MAGFTKLDAGIIHSTIWREPDHVRLVWITMLAMCNKDGVVEASLPGLADAARVDLGKCEAALSVLSSPDRYSRTPDKEGRRIEACEGGWVVLNYAKYRAGYAAKNAERARRFRARQKEKRRSVTLHNDTERDVTLHNVTERDVTPPSASASASASASEKGRGVQGGKKPKKPDPYPPDWPGHELIAEWFEQHPSWQGSTQKDRAKATPAFRRAMDGLLRIDQRTPEQVRGVLRYICEDKPSDGWRGWAACCQSPAKLRKLSKGQGVSTWQVITGQMRSKPKPATDSGKGLMLPIRRCEDGVDGVVSENEENKADEPFDPWLGIPEKRRW